MNAFAACFYKERYAVMIGNMFHAWRESYRKTKKRVHPKVPAIDTNLVVQK